MDNETFTDSWWLMYYDFPNLLWARLRVCCTGAAWIFDSDGETHRFESEKEARYWLLEDEYTEFAKLEPEDEIEYGITLSAITPPKCESDEDLKEKMYVRTTDA